MGPQVSHLCNNRACCNPDHLIAETATLNIQRKGCIGYTIFENKLVVCACTHHPKCKIVTNDVLQVVEQPPSDMEWFVPDVLDEEYQNKLGK